MINLRVAESLTKEFLLDKIFLFFVARGDKVGASEQNIRIFLFCIEVIPDPKTVINLLSVRVYKYVQVAFVGKVDALYFTISVILSLKN